MPCAGRVLWKGTWTFLPGRQLFCYHLFNSHAWQLLCTKCKAFQLGLGTGGRGSGDDATLALSGNPRARLRSANGSHLQVHAGPWARKDEGLGTALSHAAGLGVDVSVKTNI